MISRQWPRLLVTVLLGLLLGACAWERARPTSTPAPVLTPAAPMASAPGAIGCFEGVQVAPANPTGTQITASQAEERARATPNSGAGVMGELLTARLVAVTAGGSERLRGRTAWLLEFAFTPPPGQPATPPQGLAWRAYALVDADSGAYSTSCVSLLPSGGGHPELMI